jgi:hypothetical protein
LVSTFPPPASSAARLHAASARRPRAPIAGTLPNLLRLSRRSQCRGFSFWAMSQYWLVRTEDFCRYGQASHSLLFPNLQRLVRPRIETTSVWGRRI